MMLCRRAPILVGLVGAATLVGSPALAAGDADAGRDIAVTWCSACHLVEDESVANTEARSLAAVAGDERWTADALRGFLAKPHGGMPDLYLTRQEIDNLITYLHSLKGIGR